MERVFRFLRRIGLVPPANGEWLRDHMADAELVVYSGEGHLEIHRRIFGGIYEWAGHAALGKGCGPVPRWGGYPGTGPGAKGSRSDTQAVTGRCRAAALTTQMGSL